MEEFRQQIVNIFNNSDLPLDAKFYVFKDVFYEVNELYKQLLQNQKAMVEDTPVEETTEEPAAAQNEDVDAKQD